MNWPPSDHVDATLGHASSTVHSELTDAHPPQAILQQRLRRRHLQTVRGRRQVQPVPAERLSRSSRAGRDRGFSHLDPLRSPAYCHAPRFPGSRALRRRPPALRHSLLGEEQPTQPDTVGSVESHLAAQCHRCTAIRACERSSRTANASGLRTEPSGRRKPLRLSNSLSGTTHRRDASPTARLRQWLRAPVSPPLGSSESVGHRPPGQATHQDSPRTPGRTARVTAAAPRAGAGAAVHPPPEARIPTPQQQVGRA